MKPLKYLLFPFAWIYGWIIRFRHWLFDKGILSSMTYDIPLVGVGNLSLGGTGKTPVVEYLVRLLEKNHKIAILSRGYGRKTSGFLIGNQFSKHGNIGDEPMQYYRKFGKKVVVAVDEKRKRGIQHLLDNDNDLEVILLDDVFQHRYVKPGLSILLTDYRKLYTKDFLIPVGTLRDTISVAKNADIIVVTKAPKVLSPITRKNITEALKPEDHQQLYFSYLRYKDFKPVPGIESQQLPEKINSIILFTGIANSYPLQEHLRDLCFEMTVIDFPDHHVFRRKDLERVRKTFDDIYRSKKIVVTTEKDAMRLMTSPDLRILDGVPLFYKPVEVKFHKPDREAFNQQIQDYVKKNRRNS
jgi:tetraacyldisaccharide 4'-kinase